MEGSIAVGLNKYPDPKIEQIIAHKKMYEIPGQESMTEHAIRRYLRDKQQDESIRKESEIPLDLGKQKRMPFINPPKAKNEEENLRFGLEMQKKVRLLPPVDRAAFVQSGIESQDENTQIAAAEQIWNLPQEASIQLIKLCLTHRNVQVQVIAARSIFSLPSEERYLLIRECFEDGNNEVQKKLMELASDYLSGQELISLIELGLSNKNPDIQGMAVRLIRLIKNEKKEELLNKIYGEKIGDHLVTPGLYLKDYVDDKNFSRVSFPKDGSDTTLVGGDLRGKTIIRHIEPRAFIAWQEMFENWDLWEKAGFDYVPIEPIQSYKLNQRGLVDVFSGVVDVSLASWLEDVGSFKEELLEQKQKITEVLDSHGFKHGHTHNGNFCLRFFRDNKGNVDFTKTPRLYLIDFDQSISQKPS